ncbi:MAG: galactokinase family protein [Bacillota bacterium]|nr:galactokinase family protein [Bacillota bacterium]
MYDAAIKALHGENQQKVLSNLYPDAKHQTERYLHLINRHKDLFNSKGELYLLSAPGRSEIIGNHTDHNNGVVLACSVNLDTVCVVSKREDMRVNLASEGYEEISLSLENLQADERLAGTSKALILGVADGMKKRGCQIGGFDAVMSSKVLSGSGLSSSAAFEVLICFVLDVLYNGAKMDAVTRAQIGQYAENVFFMKPSGLMDQMASSFGGLVQIDFKDKDPKVESLHYSFSQKGYAMVIVNTRSSHDDLTDAYSAIPREMKQAANVAGGSVLRDVPYYSFLKALPAIREQAGDRAVLRSLHFYQENERVLKAANALNNDDLEMFFSVINASGLSSETQLQNIHVKDQEQPMTLALALARTVLKDEGACRVHGGGFAGTTLNFVPEAKLGDFTKAMENAFGPDCCHELDVRQEGPVWIR